jgi:membrane protein
MIKVTKYLQNQIDASVELFQKIIWQTLIDQNNPFQAFLIRQIRIAFLALQGALNNKIFMLAPALTFFSVLSIVPAFALALGIAKGFGLERYLEQQFHVALAGREEVFNWVMELTDAFFQHIDGGVVAIAGLGVLIYTVSMLLINIEKIFNQIWHVRYGRTWLRRLSDYFAIIFFGPLLLIVAGAVTVFLTTQIRLLEGSLLSPLLVFLLRVSPYMLIWILFTLLYMVMPNTRVRFYPALVNGIIAGSVFQLIQWAYLTFQFGAASLGAIYGSFAALPLLLISMQISWTVVLFGAELTHAAQNIDLYRYGLEPKNISPYKRKLLSLYILSMLLKNFTESPSPLTAHHVSAQLKLPGPLVESILFMLKEVKLLNPVLVETEHESIRAYQPALDAHAVTVAMALKRLEHYGQDELTFKPSPDLDNLTDTLEKMGRIIDESEANRLLIEL